MEILDHSDNVDNIGNMLLIIDKDNISISNKSYKEKSMNIKK